MPESKRHLYKTKVLVEVELEHYCTPNQAVYNRIVSTIVSSDMIDVKYMKVLSVDSNYKLNEQLYTLP